MIYYIVAFSFFCAGVIAAYFIIQYWIFSILKIEHPIYIKEGHEGGKRIIFKLFTVIELLKVHKDRYKNDFDTLKRSIIDEPSKADNNRTYKILSSKISELELGIQELKQILSNSPKQQQTIEHQPGKWKNQKQDDKSKPGNAITTVYFSIPESDGNFSIAHGETAFDDRKYYKIIYETNSDRGTLHYLSGQFDLKAIDNIDYYLTPVCEIVNISDRNSAKKVSQIETGTVLKIQDNWMIDKKVKVKLI